ncbi:hypothetical protein BGZ63DRAFT_421172 [Mariannaea sp. PMI_226]|nr:hypothetical protein BGZ63DRAFT_421172 [Mariannaea sp. PMI_226]
MSGSTSPSGSQTTTTTTTTITTVTSTEPSQERFPEPSWTRTLKQFGFFITGAGFLAASVAVSRRSVIRRQLESVPKFYSSNRSPVKFDSVDRSQMAAQALGLATLNVMSFGVMLLGGLSWGFDISSVEELQARSRKVMRGRSVHVSPEDEAEMEAMVADLMGRLGMRKPAGQEDASQEKDAQKKD